MHEATLAARLLQVAESAAEGMPGRVRAVTAVVGDMAGVMADALVFAFDALKKDTALHSAALHIERQPVTVSCGGCGEEYAPSGFPFVCPRCAERSFRLLRGEEVYVKNIEVEENA